MAISIENSQATLYNVQSVHNFNEITHWALFKVIITSTTNLNSVNLSSLIE